MLEAHTINSLENQASPPVERLYWITASSSAHGKPGFKNRHSLKFFMQ